MVVGRIQLPSDQVVLCPHGRDDLAVHVSKTAAVVGDVEVERVDRFKRQIDFRIIRSTTRSQSGKKRKLKRTSEKHYSKSKKSSHRK